MSMPTQLNNPRQRRAAYVLVQDDALSSALVFSLGIIGYNALPIASLEAACKEQELGDHDVILIDCSLITSIEAALLRELRQKKWRGTLVVVAEDESGCPACSDGIYEARLLVKPFALDDVTATLDVEPEDIEPGPAVNSLTNT